MGPDSDHVSCCRASTLCSACNATLAQETLCQLAKLVSLNRPNGRIRAIPVHRQLVTDRVARKQWDRVCLQGYWDRVEVIIIQLD